MRLSTMKICTVPASTLKGLLQIAAKSDVRYYLNSIYFDVPNRRLVASDGHALIMVNQEFEVKCEPFILKREEVELALKSKKYDVIVSCGGDPSTSGARLFTLSNESDTCEVRTIEI